MRSEKRRRSGKRRGEEKKEKKKKRGKESSPVESDPSKNRTRFQLYLPFFIDRNVSILDYGSIEFVGEKYCSVGTYLPIRNTISRNLLEIYSRNDHSPKLSPRERIENGKALVRFGRVRWAKRGNCHRGLRENRGLPTLVEYTRVSKRSGSSLTKEVGRDARRTARDRWWGKESLQLVPSFVAR